MEAGTCPARYASANSVIPSTNVTIAATVWLRVIADAKQPNERKRHPSKKIPKYVLPTEGQSSPP